MRKRIDVAFRRIANWSSNIVGTPEAFILAFISVVVWGIMGPFFSFSTNWQLIINTGTTIVTFWLVFLIQSSQNKDTRAMQMKLDKIISDISEVHGDELIGIEDNSEKMVDV